MEVGIVGILFRFRVIYDSFLGVSLGFLESVLKRGGGESVVLFFLKELLFRFRLSCLG